MNDDLAPLLRAAISGAADDIEPLDRLDHIRRMTRASASRRRAWCIAGGSLLAAAAAVTVIVAVTGPGASTGPTTGADPASAGVSPPPASQGTYPIYYVGPAPDGPAAPVAVLYSSLETGTSALDLLMRTPTDPDYRTRWPEGSLVSYTVTADSIEVIVGPGAPLDDDLAVQQLVFTLQGVEDSKLAVTVLGSPVGAAPPTFDRADDLTVLSRMSITEPAEGTVIPAGSGSFTATGQGNSVEASGACFLRGDDAFESGPYLAQMSGWMEPRLFPWELSVDLSDVPPGTYTFACATDDPSGGEEGRGADTDTRTVIVE